MADPNHVLAIKKNIVFLLPHKSGCTTMKVLIGKATGDRQSGHHEFDEVACRYIKLADITKKHLVIGVIREPMERAQSSFQWIAQKRSRIYPPDADQYCKAIWEKDDKEIDYHIRPQFRDYYNGEELLPDAWIYLEHLQEDWAALCRKVGWLIGDIPCLNYRTREDQYKLRGKEDFIRQRFKRDFELYEEMRGKRCAKLWPS